VKIKILVGSPESKRQHDRTSSKWEDNVKKSFKVGNKVGNCGLNLRCSGQISLVGSCEDSKDPFTSTKRVLI